MASPGPSDELGPDLGSSPSADAPRILVVDDDPSVRRFVTRALRRAGAEVTEAADGREALRAIADGRAKPTLLVTDIEMPAMSGIELAARATALRPGIRVVLITGSPSSAERARDHASQVESVLLKPVSTAELLDACGMPGQAAAATRDGPGPTGRGR
jgi:two-component system cell cycle response regulator CpdR